MAVSYQESIITHVSRQPLSMKKSLFSNRYHLFQISWMGSSEDSDHWKVVVLGIRRDTKEPVVISEHVIPTVILNLMQSGMVSVDTELGKNLLNQIVH